MAKLSILIGTYSNDGSNQRFIDLCTKSLNSQSFQDFEVVLVSSGKFTPKVDSSFKHIHNNEQTHYPKALEIAYQASSDSKHLLLLNDDTILNKFCLESMVNVLDAAEVILNPLSNCQNRRLYNTRLGILKDEHFVPFEQQHKFEDICNEQFDMSNDIINSSLFFEPHLIPPVTQFVAFFCTMMRRTTWERIGGIDPVYRTSCDDLDFCLRAQKEHIPSMITFGSFCFHFSGISADIHAKKEDKIFNANRIKEKFNIIVQP